MSSYADYEPRSQRSRNDKPRYTDDENDDYASSRKPRRSRYDDPPSDSELRVPSKESRRDVKPAARKDARFVNDGDDDALSDRYTSAQPMPRGGGRPPDHAFGRGKGRTRSNSRDGSGRRGGIELRDNDPPGHDLEGKTSRDNKQFRNKRDGIQDEEGGILKGKDPRDVGNTRRKRYDPDDDDEIAPGTAGAAAAYGRRGAGDSDRRRGKSYDEPLPRRRDRDVQDEDEPPRRRGKERDPYDEPEPPRRRDRARDPHDEPAPLRRSNTVREGERRPRDDRYGDYDDDPRTRRRRDDDEDRGYRSDGRDPKRRDDDRRHGPAVRSSRPTRDDGYDSDRGNRRSDRGYADDRSRRDRDRYDSDRDRDRDRKDREKKKKGFSFDPKDINKYVETGQKHYKSAKPVIDMLSKMYLDSKKTG